MGAAHIDPATMPFDCGGTCRELMPVVTDGKPECLLS